MSKHFYDKVPIVNTFSNLQEEPELNLHISQTWQVPDFLVSMFIFFLPDWNQWNLTPGQVPAGEKMLLAGYMMKNF